MPALHDALLASSRLLLLAILPRSRCDSGSPVRYRLSVSFIVHLLAYRRPDWLKPAPTPCYAWQHRLQCHLVVTTSRLNVLDGRLASPESACGRLLALNTAPLIGARCPGKEAPGMKSLTPAGLAAAIFVLPHAEAQTLSTLGTTAAGTDEDVGRPSFGLGACASAR